MVDILVLGKNGQVGTELQRSLAPLGPMSAAGRDQINVSDLTALHQALQELQPKVIVNASAYTAVDLAESEPDTAYLVNAEAVALMADHAKKYSSLLVHYSTDYVFDGSNQVPYVENAPTSPINEYGKTKLAGEQAIINSGCEHLIFRTSWVFAGHNHNFLRTMMRLAMQRDQLTVIDDQIGAPTAAALIADVTALAIWAKQRDQFDSGLYHLTAAGQTSWCGFARFIVEQMQVLGMNPLVSPDQVLAIPTTDYPTPAARPLYSLLDHSKLSQQLQVQMPQWQHHAQQAIAQLAKVATL